MLINSKLNLTLILTLLFVFYPLVSHSITDARDMKNVGLDEKLNEQVPLDLAFYDEQGKEVKFESFFKDEKPVILTLNYYGCPLICGFVLKGVSDVVNDLDSLSLGKDFNIVTVSFDPDDTAKLASEAAAKYRKALVDESFSGSWHFLTGDQQNIAKLTQVVGFKYMKDGEEFAHPSALVVLTPDGTVSRYLYGVQYESKDVKLALLEASDGKIGGSDLVNQVLLFCYQFDPVGKKYALQALNIMKAAGVFTLLCLTGLLTYFWRREGKGEE